MGRQRLDGAAQDAREHLRHALGARQALLAPGQEPVACRGRNSVCLFYDTDDHMSCRPWTGLQHLRLALRGGRDSERHRHAACAAIGRRCASPGEPGSVGRHRLGHRATHAQQTARGWRRGDGLQLVTAQQAVTM